MLSLGHSLFVALSILAGLHVVDAVALAVDDVEDPPAEAVFVGKTMLPIDVLRMAVLLPQQFVLSLDVRQQNWLPAFPASHCSTLYAFHFADPADVNV